MVPAALEGKRLFTRWFLINAFFLTALVAAGLSYGDRIHGASLIAVPAILAVFAGASAFGGRISWLAEEWPRNTERLLHEAHWLHFWSWACQIAGIISTMLGFYVIIGAGSADLATRLSGGKVALLGSLVGVVCSTVLAVEARLIEHELGG